MEENERELESEIETLSLERHEVDQKNELQMERCSYLEAEMRRATDQCLNLSKLNSELQIKLQAEVGAQAEWEK